ncbi:biotin/lipoyl-containing protein [Minwuia sp.]|uniref:acetyl-CoA carboxylase biotin carboxyl carrier protein subunit n=1 Tax=Minwuia sp. TaxID=2493630 RepID=UPI003A952226
MPFPVTLDGETHAVEIIARKPNLIVEIDGRRRTVEMVEDEDGYRALSFGGLPHEFETGQDGETAWVRSLDGRTFRITVEDPIAAAADSGAAADEIRAPMPGSVVEVLKQVGDAVRRGDTVLTIESMKLQTNLKAPRDGVLAELLVGQGDTFGKDAAVARLESEE